MGSDTQALERQCSDCTAGRGGGVVTTVKGSIVCWASMVSCTVHDSHCGSELQLGLT